MVRMTENMMRASTLYLSPSRLLQFTDEIVAAALMASHNLGISRHAWAQASNVLTRVKKITEKSVRHIAVHYQMVYNRE